MEELKALPNGCEEASHLSHMFYIPCNRPAVRMVKMPNGWTYRMCAGCTDHSIRSRGGKDVGPYVEQLPNSIQSK